MHTSGTQLALILAATLSAVPAAADDAPWNGAKCVALSGKDLTGEAVALTNRGDEQQLGAKLAAPARSIYIADGYAAKVFTAPNFGGYGRLYSTAQAATGDVTYQKTAGGYYVNLSEGGYWETVSFACAEDGVLAPIAAANASSPLTFYNDRVFTLTGYQGNHPGTTEVTLTNRDGKKLVTAKSIAYWGAGTIAEMDLDSLAITVTEVAYAGQPAVSQTVYPKAPGEPRGPKLDYLGALTVLGKVVRPVADNSTNAGSWYHTVPNLELRPVVQIIDAASWR